MKQEQYIRIRSRIREIIKGTQWEGHVFCVGGCVRDELMGLDIKDIDMVIDLPGGGVHFAVWMHNNAFTTGDIVTYPRFGTAMFRLQEFPEVELECVQSRKEKYPDPQSRNPETAFGTIEEDSFRRDLTINSLDINISTGEMVDVTGTGQQDIKDHIIRTPMDPDITYDDDPLRILRCIRFSTRYGWEIERRTFEGMLKNVHRLEIITPERIRDEFEKMLTCKHPVQAMKLLKETGAMHYVIPELEQTYEMTQNKYHFGTVWEHTLKVLEQIDSDSLVLRMAALLHDVGKICTRTVSEDGKVHFYGHEKASSEMIDGILRRLKFQVHIIQQVQFLALHHMDTKQWLDDLSRMKPKRLRELQFRCGTEGRFIQLMKLIDADNHSHAEGFCLKQQVQLILERTERMKQEGSVMFGFKLPFDGKEIMEIKGLKPGPAVKKCLEYLLKLAFVDPLRSKEQWEKCLIGFRP